jgi:hypothetical protein
MAGIQIFSAVDSKVIWKPNKAFDNITQAPGGMVGRHLKSEASEVAKIAKPLAGRRTGALRKSIKAGPVVMGTHGLKVDVTAWAPYALYHHEGIHPYVKTVLTPRGPVTWSHPGFGGNPFLTKALALRGHAPKPR